VQLEDYYPSPPTVLLVEDNSLLRWWMTSSLQSEGFRVAAPPTVEEAIDLAGVASFDVLITDWRLAEGHDGLEILNRARQKAPRTLAVLISAEAGADFSERARQRGFDLVIEKPFPVAEIVGAVRGLAGRLSPGMAS
jgi:DNA-binding response OmpR family regulator